MTLSDLPEIQITRHVRSTRLRLKVGQQQIKLTAPVFCTQRQIQSFIQLNEQWLIETWQKQQLIIDQVDRSLPQELQLFNLERPLQIIYQKQKQSFLVDLDHHHLFISDRTPERYLKAFVIEYAKVHLPVYLSEVSQQCALPYGLCSIRQPKTRWGSCTSKHDIMLNSGLVLFSKEITRYVCVHELAHTKHFDHSPQFWGLVGQYDQNYQQHRKELKASPMPWWWV